MNTACGRGRFGAALITCLLSCLAVALAEPATAAVSIRDWEEHGELESVSLRQILQTRNGTTPPPSPPSDSGSASKDVARVTGALALYSLFGLFVFSSVSTVIVGIIVSVQWPNPRVCCYHTPHSDVPSSDSCTCCALHRLNIGFAVTWLALLVLLVLAFIIYLMAAAAVLAIIHSIIAYRLVRQLKQSYAANMQAAMMMGDVGAASRQAPVGLVTGVVIERPLPGVPLPGIAVVDIPLMVAVVDSRLLTQIGFEQTAAAAAAAEAATAVAGPGAAGAAAGPGGVGVGRVASVAKRSGSSSTSAGWPLSPVGSGRVASASAAGPAGPGPRSAAASPSGAAASGAAGGAAAGGAAAAVVPVALVVDERIVPPGVSAAPQRAPPPPPAGGAASPAAAGQAGATRWGSGLGEAAALPHPLSSPTGPAAASPGGGSPAAAAATSAVASAPVAAAAVLAAAAPAGSVGGPADADPSYPLLQPPSGAPASRVRAGPQLSAEVPPPQHHHHHGFRTSGSGGGGR